jgi:type I restriction enzyme M protein
MPVTPDFNLFGEQLWRITGVFQDDGLSATERLETLSLFLFLKLWDEMVLEQEKDLGRPLKDEELAIPNKYRFHKWVSDPDGYAKQNGYEDSVDFCRCMFNDLATRKVLDQYGNDITFDVRRLFEGTVFRLRYTTTIRALVSKLNEMTMRDIILRSVGESGERFDIFGRAYEYLLQRFGQKKEFAEYFTPRHIVDRV